MVDEAQAVLDYESSLSELAANSKPHINMLTMLAEENQVVSPKIVQVIESHIQKVPSQQKLPVLYLIDSIVKNCADTNYKELFSRHIISIFVHVFKEGDEKTRTSMFKLRQTWAGLFLPSKLYGIDIKVNQIDPAWPVTAPTQLKAAAQPQVKAAGEADSHATIHVNPKFLQQQMQQKSGGPKVVAVKEEEPSLSKQKEDLLKSRVETELKLLRQKKEDLEKARAIAQAKARQVVVKGKGVADNGGFVNSSSRELERQDSKKRWAERYNKEKRDSEGDRSDREKSPERKKNKSSLHKGRNYRKSSHSPTANTIDQDFRDDSPVAETSRKQTLPPKKRMRSDEEVNSADSASEAISNVKSMRQRSEPIIGTGNQDEDLRILLQQSPPHEQHRRANTQSNRIPKIGDRPRPDHLTSHHHNQNRMPPRPPAPAPAIFEHVAVPTVTPGSHAFDVAPVVPLEPPASAAGPPLRHPTGGLLPVPVSAPLPPQPQPMSPGVRLGYQVPPMRFDSRYPPPGRSGGMGIRPQNVQNMDVKPPDPIPANNRIFVDGKAYEVKYVEDIPVIERNGQPHKIYFTGPPRDVVIDGNAYSLAFGDKKTVMIDGQPHIIRFGAPGRELYMGSYPFRGAFGGPLIYATINGNRHELRLCGPPPEVKIEPEPCYELIPRMPQRYPARAGPVHDFGYSEPRRMPPPEPDAQPMDGPAQQLNPQLDLSKLLSNLMEAGIIGGAKEGERKSGENTAQRAGKAPSHKAPKQRTRPPTPPIPSGHAFKDEEEVERQSRPPPNLKDMSMRVLRVRYTSVVDNLYPTKQTCPNCGLRFEDIDEQRYRRHLDWHFRENARAKDTTRGGSRPWYFAAEDWINYTEQGDDPATKSKSGVLERGVGSEADNIDSTSQEPFVVAADSGEQACSVCGETFENFFDDDEDTWKCRNAIVVEGKLFHPVCYQDVSLLQTSTTDPVFSMQPDVSYSVPPGLDVAESTEGNVKTEPISRSVTEIGDQTVLSEINRIAPVESSESDIVDRAFEMIVPCASEYSNNALNPLQQTAGQGASAHLTADRVKREVEDTSNVTQSTSNGAFGGIDQAEPEDIKPEVRKDGGGTPLRDEPPMGVIPGLMEPVEVYESPERQRSPGTPVRDEII